MFSANAAAKKRANRLVSSLSLYHRVIMYNPAGVYPASSALSVTENVQSADVLSSVLPTV